VEEGGTSWLITKALAPILAWSPTRIGPSRMAFVPMMPDVGVPPPAVLSRTAQCYVVEHHAVVADRGRLANHHPGSVVEEEPSADLRPRVDLDSGPEACHHGEKARNQPQSQTSMNPVGKAIEQDCVERCMTEDDLEPTMCRRIIPLDRPHVFQCCLDHGSLQEEKRLRP
jgi:hypothetical protein